MDTTKIYIKMCDCLEIQEKSRNYNDRCCFWANRLFGGGFSIWADLHRDDSIWLPRQDQIQEMMEKHESNLDLLVHFYGFVTVDNPMGIKKIFDASMEQLWLAFYMFEKHSKVWSSKEEKWVKE